MQTPNSLSHTITQLCPDYQGLELGIGESILQKAIAESTGRKMDAIKAAFKEEGDLGVVAQVCMEKLRLSSRN